MDILDLGEPSQVPVYEEDEYHPDVIAAAEEARYVVRIMGDPAIKGYTESLERAYGRALYIAYNTTEGRGGVQIDNNKHPSHQIQLLRSEDGSSVTVQRVAVEASSTEQSLQ